MMDEECFMTFQYIFKFKPFTSKCHKKVRHTLKILQKMLFKVCLTILRQCEVKRLALIRIYYTTRPVEKTIDLVLHGSLM